MYILDIFHMKWNTSADKKSLCYDQVKGRTCSLWCVCSLSQKLALIDGSEADGEWSELSDDESLPSNCQSGEFRLTLCNTYRVQQKVSQL